MSKDEIINGFNALEMQDKIDVYRKVEKAVNPDIVFQISTINHSTLAIIQDNYKLGYAVMMYAPPVQGGAV